jgi:hypothetical protein
MTTCVVSSFTLAFVGFGARSAEHHKVWQEFNGQEARQYTRLALAPARCRSLRLRSKNDLVAAALAHSSELAIERLRRFRRPAKWDDRFVLWPARGLGVKPRWSGGGFTCVVVGLPICAVTRACDRAREIMLLMEGAMALMLIHGARSKGPANAGRPWGVAMELARA